MAKKKMNAGFAKFIAGKKGKKKAGLYDDEDKLAGKKKGKKPARFGR